LRKGSAVAIFADVTATFGSAARKGPALKKGALEMLTREEDVLATAEAWRDSGREVAIATVVETWGSAPRPVGSHLVIAGDGAFLGSVSGGCVVGAVVEEAAEVIASGAARMLEFGVADETAWRVGLSCGGRIKVYVEKLV
jgi:xanthine/CO dehydrogenase XdhC/CoxF family maturation factor